MKWNPEVITESFFKRLRYKQWDFYSIYTQNLTLCAAIADLYYVKNVFVTIYETGKDPITIEKVIPGWEPMKMSNTSQVGTSLYNSSSWLVFFYNLNRYSKSILIQHGDIDINLSFKTSSLQDGIVYLMPFNSDKSQFFYAHKQYNYDVQGYVKIGTRDYIIYNELGVMDWGRGVWPYNGGWIWGSGSGKQDNDKIGLNIGQLPGDSSSEVTDDCVFINNFMIKLGVVVFHNPDNLNDEWRFRSLNPEPDSRFGYIEGKFVPEKLFKKSTNLWLIKSELNQLFGVYEAEVRAIEGTFSFKVRGILEVHESRW